MAESRRNGRRKRALADITNNSQSLSTISSSSSSKPNNNITETNPTAKLLNPNFVVSLKKSANPPASAASSDCRNNEVFNPSLYPKSHTTRKTKSGNENDKYQISGDAIAIHHQADAIPQKPPATSTSSATFIQPANNSAAPSQPSFQILAPVVSIQPPNASALSSQPSIRRLVPAAAARLGTSRRHSADKSCKGKEIANAQTEGVSPARWIPTFLRQTNGSGTDKDKNQIAGGSTPIDQTAITIHGSSNQKLMSATAPGTGGFGVSPHSVSTPRQLADRANKGKEIAATQPEGLSPARWTPSFLRKTTDTSSGKDKNQTVGGPTHMNQTVITNPGSSNQKSVSAAVPGTDDFGVSHHSVSTPRQLADRANKGKEIAAAQPLGLSPARWTPTFLRQTTETQSGKEKNQIAGGSTQIDQTVITNPGTDDCGVSPHSVYTRRKSADRTNKAKEIAGAQSLSLSPARRKADLSSNKRKVDGDIKARSCILPGKKYYTFDYKKCHVTVVVTIRVAGLKKDLRKQRVMPAKKDDSLPQEFIEQQRAYFKEVDDFELAVEEVSSGDESD
ncbi:hypothetical protein ACFE04_017717 [Oxalis oulophora]